MKNDEFRKLVTAARKDDGSPPQSVAQRALGGKKSSFAGMTPRPGKAVSNADFARQIRERHASLQPTKKHKSSAPKGSKFAAGYTDRAQARREAEEAEDDKEKRIKALEEQVKLGTLSQETFESLRDQIIGDDASSSHLVKGLDRKLLERVRRGEDVLGLGNSKDGSAPPDVDDELDKLEEKDVEAVAREKTEKKGTKASQIAGVKRTRDEIMADLKAQRKAAAEAKAAAAPSFDSRWRKVGDAAKPKIEIDSKGREVLITVDENGVVKKKIRKVAADPAADAKAPDDTTDASACKPVLGADVAVPEQPKQQPESEDDDDIFEGAGTEYNPLGDMEDDSDDDDDDETDEKGPKKQAEPSLAGDEETRNVEKKPELDTKAESQPASGPRNYFKDTTNDAEDTQQDRFKGIENVLKKAAQIGAEEQTNEDGHDQMSKEEREARAAKRAKLLAQEDRDLEDMDMGFGSSRFEDEEGAADKKQRLSKWKNNTAADDEGWEEDGNEGEAKKKRKGKKRKGDVNNVDDIMKVIEGRKAAGGSK